jgi:hypothetical protein
LQWRGGTPAWIFDQAISYNANAIFQLWNLPPREDRKSQENKSGLGRVAGGLNLGFSLWDWF